MELICVDCEKYDEIVKHTTCVYNASWFHEINRHKVDEIKYMLFKTTKYKLSLITGIQDKVMKIPYSAPFSMFETIGDVQIEEIEEAVDLLEQWCLDEGVEEILFRIPPPFYDVTFIGKLHNVLQRKKFDIEYSDLNYQFYIADERQYMDSLKRNARKNLNTALKCAYELIHCEAMDEKKLAYDIIKENREAKGYPLRMTWEEVSTTSHQLWHDFFLLQLDGEYVASAVVFGVTQEVYQVIYWGDKPGYEKSRPMNYLAFRLYQYYLQKGVNVLDIGPSTEEGVPNYGLCSFKESIGCAVSIKNTYRKELRHGEK